MRFFYPFLILFLGFAVAFRFSLQEEPKLAREGHLKIAATLKSEPRISEDRQILKVSDLRIYTGLFPRYSVGERLIVEGESDKSGNISYPKIERIATSKSYFAGFRREILENINKLLPGDEAALVAGTILGADLASSKFRKSLIWTGTIHVVVVSGQNLTILSATIMAFAKYIGRKKALFASLAAVFLYAFLVGLEPPVVRAGLMVFMSVLAIYFGREVWPVWNLILAAFIILFFKPAAISEISFQLTFAATLGIMLLGNSLAQSWSKIPFLGQGAAVAISAYIFTAPLIVYYFGRLSVIAPLVNVLVMEAVSPVMILGFLTAGFSLLFWPLAQIAAYFAFIPSFYFVRVVGFFGNFELGQVQLGSGNLTSVILFYAAVFLGLVGFRRWFIVRSS